MRIKTILVATDFGDVADIALAYGRALAQQFGAQLRLLHVGDNPFLRPTAADPASIEAMRFKTLNRCLTEADRRDLHARAILEVSDAPAEAIVRCARTEGADLVVMGTHGRHGPNRWLVGSVAAQVVREASCPVLTVRHPERDFVSVEGNPP